jgi:7-cyano-7-deazaguanine synthase
VNKLAVISFSGGLDSTSLLLNLLNNGYKVFALSFNYGQKHIIELEKAKQNIHYLSTKGFNVSHKIVNLSDCMELLSSSLINKDLDVPIGHYEQSNMKSTFVPNRNAIFSSILYGYAISLSDQYNKSMVIISLGVHSGDHAIYPDCRKEFYIKLFDSFNEGNWNSENIKMYLPYINFDKSKILLDAQKCVKKLNLDFNTIFKNTITSYNPDSSGKSDGKTGSDIERILAFDSIGIKDPIKYQNSWDKVLADAKKIEKDYKNN